MFTIRLARPLRRKIAPVARECGPVLIILVAFVSLGLFYSRTIPIFEGPNETWHMVNVALLRNREVPRELELLATALPDLSWQEPPLYYRIASLLVAGIEPLRDASPYEPNPYATVGMPDVANNKNVVLHVERDDDGRGGMARTVAVLRQLSLAFSLVTIALTHRAVRIFLPHRPALALGASALVALNPEFIFLSSGATPHALTIALVTASLYLGVRLICKGGRPIALALALGLTTGLCALTEQVGLSSLLLVPIACVLAYDVAGNRDLWRGMGVPILAGLGVAVLVCGWWYVVDSHWPPSLAPASWGIYVQASEFGHILGLLSNVADAYWGLFGWLNVPAARGYYTAVRVVTMLAMSGLLLLPAKAYWNRQSLRQPGARCATLLAIWSGLLAAILLGRVGQQPWIYSPWLLVAICSTSILLVLGLASWLAQRLTRLVVAVLLLLFAGLSATVPARFIDPVYALPTRIQLEDTPTDIQDLNIAFGDELFLLGYTLEADSLQAGDSLPLRLYWLALKKMGRNYTFAVNIIGQPAAPLGGAETYSGGGNYPTSLWTPGEVVYDDYLIPVAEDASAPTTGSIRVTVIDSLRDGYVTATDSQGRSLGAYPEVGRVRIGPELEVSYQPQSSLQVGFDDQALLYGYDLLPEQPVAGEIWEVNLYWRALRSMSKDYTVFLHLVDGSGNIVAQIDEQPMRGSYPTHFWRTGEDVRDRHYLTIPTTVRSGRHELRVGLYYLPTGERLAISNAMGPRDTVILGPVDLVGN